MAPSASRHAWQAYEDEADDAPQPLTAEEARQRRAAHPRGCLWCVLGVQLAVGAVVALLAALIGGRATLGWSAAYGVLAVAGPTALFIAHAHLRFALMSTALVNLLMAEMVKILLTVVLLALAPRLLPGLSWPALLLGLIVALKAYWLGAAWVAARARKSRRRPTTGTTLDTGASRRAAYGVEQVHGC